METMEMGLCPCTVDTRMGMDCEYKGRRVFSQLFSLTKPYLKLPQRCEEGNSLQRLPKSFNMYLVGILKSQHNPPKALTREISL
jgi:hypothetical protein